MGEFFLLLGNRYLADLSKSFYTKKKPVWIALFICADGLSFNILQQINRAGIIIELNNKNQQSPMIIREVPGPVYCLYPPIQ